MNAHGDLIANQELDRIYRTVGSFIVGCGCLELQTFIWIEGFSPTERGKWRTKKKRFHDRKGRVLQIVDAMPIEQVYKTGAGEIWADASKVMDFRNVIAHNPVIFRYDGPAGSIIESVRIPSIKDFSDGDFPDFTLSQLEEQLHRVGDVNTRLENYRRVIESAIGTKITVAYKYGDQSGKSST